jgi:tetratricopeptide (TPR) repeat protein
LTVSKAPILLEMKDSFYESFQVPKLPLPVYLSSPDELIRDGEIRFSVITDNLCRYLLENVDKEAEYQPMAARMAHEAGVYEGRQGRFEDANRYLKIAKQFQPLDLMIAADLARSYLDLNMHEAALDEFLGLIKVLGTDGFSPEVWLSVAHIYFRIGKKRKARSMVNEYITKVREFYPEQVQEMLEYGLEWSLQNDGHPSMVGLFVRYVKPPQAL